MDTVWGGVRSYTADKTPALLEALHKFIGQPKDPKAAIIFLTLPNGNDTPVTLSFFYDGPKAPPGVFCGLEDIKASLDVTSEIAYSTLVGHLSQK